tara:strand:+ start:488 stop:1117 length:630 start_codon:yes stop_codon:yes gene_type:complete
MSTLKVDTILKRTGTGTITVGQSGDTVAMPTATATAMTVSGTTTLSTPLPVASGGTGGASFSAAGLANAPAFYTFLNANQSAGTGADTIITLNAESLDTDNAFNTSTYKFIPQTAGKYFLYGQARIDSGTDFNMLTVFITYNGSQIARGHNYNDYTNTVNVSTIVDMNGSSDYIQMAAMQNSGGSLNFQGSGTQANSGTYLMGYKLIGV